MWATLHRRPLAYVGDAVAERDWLTRFASLIPNDCSCRCQDHWMALVARNPPDLQEGPSLARWGFRMHNLVSRAIGKPECPWEAARGLWGWPEEWTES
jgi:hypothetical protein